MADLSISYDEEMVGAGHPTKEDTLNRLALAEHASDGAHGAAAVASLAGAGLGAGYRIGLTPRYKDVDELYLAGGVLEIDGLLCGLSAETPFDMDAGGAFGPLTWYTFGFRQPSGGNALTGSELVTTGAPPVYSAGKKGFYDSASGARVINRFKTDAAGNIDPASLWAGPGGLIYSHGRTTLLSDTTPATSAEAISADVPAWGLPVLCGGYSNIRHASAAVSQYILHGNGVIAGQQVTQTAASYTGGPWTALAGPSGQIRHYAGSGAFTDYVLYKSWDSLPAGI
ncbi:MAG: hypothetical protein K9K66_14170 [Desulfarculaceae bacterium]|nr:hypothetical protein [Desulfarculaceae bacterium]MCF8073818.1 hypothetical protein [Desulfarculaceae bacterium]MCF8102798.1 hypothetical protein [Desulfarculaceae bacterium]MCF8116242.1 hypothetical protein [Desulfarculaceae bacterium]